MESPTLQGSHDSGEAASDQISRPYRSKRMRPCDVCRRRRTACRIEGEPPCAMCRQLGVECRFERPPVKRRVRQPHYVPQHQGMELPGESDFLAQLDREPGDHLSGRFVSNPGDAMAWDTVYSPNAAMVDAALFDPEFTIADAQPISPSSRLMSTNGALTDGIWQDGTRGNSESSPGDSQDPVHGHESEQVATTLNCLDQIDGFTAQYFGLSGESDPYLLRHFRFAAEGETKFFKVHFRRLAREQADVNPPGIPIQFMISSDELGDSMKPETNFRPEASHRSARDELNDLVNPKDGQLLVGLFLRFIFPTFPIISRSQLGLEGGLKPSLAVLAGIPTHLLAAIYALATQFCHHDSVLCVSNVYQKPPADRLWKMVLEEVFIEIHTPRLSVLQAILIYLQRTQTGATSAVADSPFRWSLVGFAHSLANTLGLHLDCRRWQIPEWEKRLRRRLWWAMFSECTWRSLLLGFASPIIDEQWDVAALDTRDFLLTEQNGAESTSSTLTATEKLELDIQTIDFFYLTQLACVARDIYRTLYSLKATKRLATDFRASLSAAKPLRTRMEEWYASLPERYKIHRDANIAASSARQESSTAAYLRFAYLILELFICRALIRPTGSLVPNEASDTAGLLDPNQCNTAAEPATQSSPTSDPAVDAVFDAALNCATVIVSYISILNSRDFDSFWFSWMRICFATMSNFVVTLLIQAPSREHAVKAKELVDEWKHILRNHSRTFGLTNLGLLRLNAMHYVGLKDLSRASKWGTEVIQ